MLEHKPELRSAHLFTLTLELGPIHNIGPTLNGHRRIVEVKSGRFEGEEFSGIVLPGGGDWITMRPDEVVQLDVRLTLKTNDGALVYMTYRGMRHGPPWVMEKVNKGEKVDPTQYYFRTTPLFETASEKYGFLNRIITVATGRREPSGPIYDVFQIL
jgi:hypothetical protein